MYVIADALGSVPKTVDPRLDELEIRERINTVQTTVLLMYAKNTKKGTGHLWRHFVTYSSAITTRHLV